MSLTTPNFDLPYPELPDAPNVPSDMLALATRLDDVLQQLQEQVFLPRRAMGRVAIPGSTGALKVSTGFQPQKVRIVSVYTAAQDPVNRSDTNSLQVNEGLAGLDINGNLVQHWYGVSTEDGGGIGSSVRIRSDRCAGLILGGSATPIGGASMTSLDIDGFTINVLDSNSDGNSYEYWWEADQ